MPTDVASEVSVVVCVKNGANTIYECLTSIAENFPKELIVVDGNSTDGTLEIVQAIPKVQILSDEGKGLSYARRIGAEKAKGKFVMYVGPDNLMENGFIDQVIKEKQLLGFDVVSVRTRVKSPITYWDKGLDFRWQCLMSKVGPIKVAGTPSVYEKDIFKEINFSDSVLGPSDDTDIAEALRAKGYKIGLVPVTVYDQNGLDKASVIDKFRWYGTGDFYFYKKYEKKWTLIRKLKSILHPGIQFIAYTLIAIKSQRFEVIPWLVMTTFVRYSGWIKMARIK